MNGLAFDDAEPDFDQVEPGPRGRPVPAGAETAAAAAFKAYLVASDQTKAAALAATGSQATFAAEFARQDAYWRHNPVRAARDTAGFSGTCNYR